MRHLALLAVLFLVSSCTDEDASRAYLVDHGYTDITLHGYNHFACVQKHYRSRVSFKAKKDGRFYDGTVCCSLLVGCTTSLLTTSSLVP